MNKKDIPPKIQQFLIAFGLSDSDIEVYLALLQSGPSSIAHLQHNTNIPRTTVYATVERLMEKGLVNQSKIKRRRQISAESPDQLKVLLMNQKIELEETSNRLHLLEENLHDAIEDIYNLVPQINKTSHITIKYYQGKKEVSQIYREAFRAKEIRSYVNLGQIHKVFPENDRLYIQVQKQFKSKLIREIIDDSKTSIQKAKEFTQYSKFEYRVKLLPANSNPIDIMIFDDKVAMINFSNDIIGSVLINKAYYENAKALFEFLWESLPKP